MIQIITGTLIEVESNRKEPVKVQQILEKKNQTLGGLYNFATGLGLEKGEICNNGY